MSETESRQRRAPAFQLYADDFLSGTMDMSQEDVGAYIRLLCHQWNRGSIPVATERQQRLAGGCVSVEVLSKFEAGPDGNLRNRRLEEVRAVSDAYRQKQAEKGKKSAEIRNAANRGTNHGSTAAGTAAPTGRQPKGQPEGNSPSPSPSSKDIFLSEGFALFWSKYPRKTAKDKAEASWKRLNPSPELEDQIISDVLKRKTSPDWCKEGGQYIPHPTTYLNQKRWEEVIEVSKPIQTYSDGTPQKDWKTMTDEEILRASL
jgi:uncharacterized protein YdaU (DUF1376 family)